MASDATPSPVPHALPTSGAAGGRPAKGILRERFEALPNKVLDEKMGKGESWAKNVGYGNQGVMLDDVPVLMGALGLKIVEAHRICITPEQRDEYEACRTLARARLVAPAPRLEQDWDRKA